VEGQKEKEEIEPKIKKERKVFLFIRERKEKLKEISILNICFFM